METMYFDVNVFHNRKDSYSKFFKMEVKEHFAWQDEDILNEVIKQGVIDSDEANHADYIEEISEIEYYELTRR